MTSAFDNLNPKQQAFVLAYTTGPTAGNATASYVAAGYTGKGRSAENASSRLLGNVGVATAIKARLEAANERQAKRGALTDDERHDLLADIARDTEAPHTARVSAIATDAKLRGVMPSARGNNRTPVEDGDDNPASRAARIRSAARADLEARGLRVVGE